MNNSGTGADEPGGRPRPSLSVFDAVALTVGIVVGAGIFKTPSAVAASAGSAPYALAAWLLGGAVSLAGALCYAELTTTFPHPGGDYHYLSRAYGKRLAFLFAWSRITVIQTGSIALLSFVFGDYASQLLRLGPHSSSVYALLLVAALTALNLAGVRQSKRMQNVVTTVEVLSLVSVALAGLLLAAPPAPAGAVEDAGAGANTQAQLGVAMILVLLTYGGWNEAAYISAEVRGPRRNMMKALLVSVAVITAEYVLVNAAYLRGLGFEGVARSEVVAADLMSRAAGEGGARLISLMIAVSTLTSANTTIITGARSAFAFGRDFAPFAFLGRWNERANTPARALVVQGALAAALVLLGTLARGGFETMVNYTAPVFWLFFLLAGFSLIVLRVREPGAERPFRVPLYPLTPLLFCATAGYLLYSSLAYTGVGASVGVGVLLAGVLLLLATRRL